MDKEDYQELKEVSKMTSTKEPIKISTLIEKLKQIQENEGDLDVLGYNDEFGECYPIGLTPWFLEVHKKAFLAEGEYHSSIESEYPVRNEEIFKNLTDKILII